MIIVLSVLIMLDLHLRPVIKSVVANRAQVVSTRAVNDAILQELGELDIKYSDLVTIERSESGKVLALTTNTILMNQLKARFSMAIQDRLSRADVSKINIPLGTLLGAEICSGLGPVLPLKITISGSVTTDFESNFCEAGINQTRHRIYINVHTRIGAIIPGYPTTTNIDTNITVAETIIVGEVPSVYASGDKDTQKAAELNSLKQ